MEEECNELSLELTVVDPVILSYLKQFTDEETRNDKAMEALKVGVIALQSASPSLDTSVVSEKFTAMQAEMNKNIDGLKDTLVEYYRQYFDPEGGAVKDFLDKQLGASSEFSKKLDPANKESIISQVEEKVQQLVKEQVDSLQKAFSLDEEDSALSRFKKSMDEQMGMIKTDLAAFQSNIATSLGWDKTFKKEENRGAKKGMVFEALLYEHVAQVAEAAGDSSRSTGHEQGAVLNSTKGDCVITIGATHVAAGEKIVIEAKQDQSYTFIKSIEELQVAKENRKAKIGIFAYAKGYEPPEVNEFRREGNDFYVVVDREDIEAGNPSFFIDAAIKIARNMIALRKEENEKAGLDVKKTEDLISNIFREIEEIADCMEKSTTIQKHAEYIGKKLGHHSKAQRANLDALIELLELELDLDQITTKTTKKKSRKAKGAPKASADDLEENE